MSGKLWRITIHWTAGLYNPNATDKSHYHYLINGDSTVINGTHKPEDNIDCKDGNYAAHCGGGNTGNIGVAICGMGSKDCFIRRRQLEACCKKVAELSIKYNIPVDSLHIFTHSEFGEAHPDTSSYGKIDIDKLPCVCLWDRQSVGNWLRNKVGWYRSKLNK